MKPVEEVLGVYDADGGVRGEAAYVVGKLWGRVHCSLCDITHSPVRRKREWDDLVRSSATPVRVVHRNELSPQESAALRGVVLPVVVGRTAGAGWRVLLDADALAALDGSVDGFRAALDGALG